MDDFEKQDVISGEEPEQENAVCGGEETNPVPGEEEACPVSGGAEERSGSGEPESAGEVDRKSVV